MCLTKGPQSLGSSAELGICSQEGLLSQVLEAFQRNNFASQGKSRELGRVKGAGFWHNVSVTPHKHYYIYASWYHESERWHLHATHMHTNTPRHTYTDVSFLVSRHKIIPNESHSKFSQKHIVGMHYTHKHAYCIAERDRGREIETHSSVWHRVLPKELVRSHSFSLSLSHRETT